MSPYQQKAANAASSHEDILIESKRGHFHRVMTAVLTVAAKTEPVSVQVVEWVGLVDLFRAVFAEEVGGFRVAAPVGPI